MESQRRTSWLNSRWVGWSLQDTESTLDEDAMLRLLDVPEELGRLGTVET